MPALPGSRSQGQTCAGGVFSYFCSRNGELNNTRNVVAMKAELTDGGIEARSHGGPGQVIGFLIVLLGLCIITISKLPAAEPLSATNSLITQPLSRSEAINVALRQNPSILRAQKDVAAAHGVMIQTRAIAMPKLRLTGNYTAVEPTDVDKPPPSISGSGFSFGTDQSW